MGLPAASGGRSGVPTGRSGGMLQRPSSRGQLSICCLQPADLQTASIAVSLPPSS